MCLKAQRRAAGARDGPGSIKRKDGLRVGWEDVLGIADTPHNGAFVLGGGSQDI